MKAYRTRVVCFLLLLGIVGACGLFCKDGGQGVAVVNGDKIPVAEFETRLHQKKAILERSGPLGDSRLERLKKELLNEMIDETLMLQRAKKLGLSVSGPELRQRIEEIRSEYGKTNFDEFFRDNPSGVESWKEELRKRILLEKVVRLEANSGITISDEEVAERARQLRIRPDREKIHASHIVLPDRRQAEAALERINAGDDFAQVAKEMSTAPEAARGGDLGTFGKGVMPEPFDRVVFSLSPGQVSRVIETPYGFHIFKVIEKKDDAETVKEDIRTDIRREKEDRAYAEWLDGLRSGARLVINDAVLKRIGEKE